MLSPNEHKIVISTLTQRRAWLRKSLDDTSLDPSSREEYIESTKLLDSSLQKLAKLGGAPSPAQQAKPQVVQAVTEQPRKKITTATARLLIAEDNGDSANLLIDILSDLEFKQIDYAKDGIEAFDKIKTSQDGYDLILCDWDMPGLSGLEVHKKSTSSNTLRGAHFMMVTAVSEGSRIREAIQQGIADYIVKPIDVDVLEGKIKAALNLDDQNN